MPPASPAIVDWVARHVLAHEPAVRAWLRHSGVPRDEVDDLVQEAYCRLAALPSVDHVDNPRAYFFQVARNLLAERVRRARLVPMEALTETTVSSVLEDERSPERVVAARAELERLQRSIDALPERCRQVFVLRKIQGLSQREIARQLGIPESTVENDVVKGLKLLRRALLDGEEGR